MIAGWSWPILAGSCAVVLLSGVLRGFSGFGFALAASPLLALLIPPRDAVPVVLILQLGSSLIGVRQSLARWDRDASLLIAVAAIAITPLGVLLLNLMSANATRIGMALVTLSAVVVLGRRRIEVNLAGRWKALPFGLAAGLLGGACAMPGPPVIAYFMARGAPPPVARASMNLIFLGTSMAALITVVAGGAIHWSAMVLALFCAPAMVFGTIAGSWAFERTSPTIYRRVGLGALATIAVVALLRTMLG